MRIARNQLDITRIWKHARSIAHALHTASGDNIFISGENALRGKHDRLHPTSAHLVNGSSIGPMLHPRSEGDLTSGGLTNSSLDDIAEENLLDFFRRDVVLVKGMF